MVSGINQTDDKSLQLLALQMQEKINNADTDGISGLSRKELSSINTDDNLDAEAFLKTLSKEFDKLDKNQDGQLSTDEILNSSFKEQLGPPLGFSFEPLNGKKDVQSFAAKALNKINEDVKGSELKNEIFKTASNFFQNLIDNYKDVSINSLKTSLNSLIWLKSRI